MKTFDREKSKATKQLNNPTAVIGTRPSSQSPLRGASPGGSAIDDWVTCIDPKTQRK